MSNLETVLNNVIQTAQEYNSNMDYCAEKKSDLGYFEIHKLNRAIKRHRRAVIQAINALYQELTTIEKVENEEAQ